VGDVIVAVDGKPVKTVKALDVELGSRRPGSKVLIDYLRKAWRSDAIVTVGEPARPGEIGGLGE
jgi:S1-C subfamily serine protease